MINHKFIYFSAVQIYAYVACVNHCIFYGIVENNYATVSRSRGTMESCILKISQKRQNTYRCERCLQYTATEKNITSSKLQSNFLHN